MRVKASMKVQVDPVGNDPTTFSLRGSYSSQIELWVNNNAVLVD